MKWFATTTLREARTSVCSKVVQDAEYITPRLGHLHLSVPLPRFLFAALVEGDCQEVCVP